MRVGPGISNGDGPKSIVRFVYIVVSEITEKKTCGDCWYEALVYKLIKEEERKKKATCYQS